MSTKKQRIWGGRLKGQLLLSILLVICLALPAFAGQWPITFTDGAGTRVTLQKPPRNVVSLSPAVSEIIFALGAGKAIKGVTYHETLPMEVAEKAVVGGFLRPSVTAIERLKPDVIFLTSLQKKGARTFCRPGTQADSDKPQLAGRLEEWR